MNVQCAAPCGQKTGGAIAGQVEGGFFLGPQEGHPCTGTAACPGCLRDIEQQQQRAGEHERRPRPVWYSSLQGCHFFACLFVLKGGVDLGEGGVGMVHLTSAGRRTAGGVKDGGNTNVVAGSR